MKLNKRFTNRLSKCSLAASLLISPAVFAAEADRVDIKHNNISCRQATKAEAAFFTTPVLMPNVISPKDGTCFINNLRITAADGVELTANAFLPADAIKNNSIDNLAKKPAILYISSWSLTDAFEYLGNQHNMAKAGYVSLSYTTRGFWKSGGMVGVAGEKDINDVSRAIDFMIDKLPVDAGKIGSAGISYGAGLSLLGAAHDNRIRALAALSGWGNLTEQLYGNEVPNTTWLKMLMATGRVTGRIGADVIELSNSVLNPNLDKSEVNNIINWANARSPSFYLDKLNYNKPAIFISKNWQDDMFSPNSTLKFFDALKTEKKILLQSGLHGSRELSAAMLGSDNNIWNETARWFDFHLKGENNGIKNEPKIRMEEKFSGAVDYFDKLSDKSFKRNVFWMAPRGDNSAGILSSQRGDFGLDIINNGIDTVATTGAIPIVSVMSETAGLPVLAYMPAILNDYGVRYESGVLESGLKIRGIPHVQLRIRPSGARAMVVAYLYSVNKAGWGRLITHGARAVHWADDEQIEKGLDFNFDLNAISYDVPAGDKLALVFDTQDHLYGSPVDAGEGFSVRIEAGDGVSALVLPSK